jgi:hypothetical protein
MLGVSMKIHLGGHKKCSRPVNALNYECLLSLIGLMDSKPRHTAGPKPCRSSDALPIYWRLNRVVWIAVEKQNERDKNRFSAAQRVHTTNDRDLLPCRPKSALHKRDLPIGERALDCFETGLVKL